MSSSPDRQIIIDGDIARIPLTRDKWAIVDKQDIGIVSGRPWCSDGSYAVCGLKVEGKYKKVYLHRVLAEPDSNQVVDHINGDTFDNRRSNLRVCTMRENFLNKGLYPRNTSGYKGVDLVKRCGKFRARVSKFGERINIGLFDTAEEAARAYDEVTKEYLGEFARLNFSQ